MISFVWSDPLPLYSGRGGSESFTIGHVRELLSRGINARIITVGLGKNDGRQFFPDVPFHDILSTKQLQWLDDKIIFVSRPHSVKTKHKSFVILHNQPPADPELRSKYARRVQDKGIIVNSKFNRGAWSEYLGLPPEDIKVVYPFADPSFSAVKRLNLPPIVGKKVNLLFAGRLTPEKGVYTLLEALHHSALSDDCQISVTTAGNQTKDGKLIEHFLRSHPRIRLVNATHTPTQTAKLFAKYQIVVVPSNPRFWTSVFGYWREPFGMISVEAQHAGCIVVASNDGGLPETDCGGLLLFNPASSYSLALTIQKAVKAGPLSIKQRRQAAKHFTLAESVNALLAIIGRDN